MYNLTANFMDIENIALDLLDFCGGEEPTFETVKRFMVVRGLHLTPDEITRLLTTANGLLAMP